MSESNTSSPLQPSSELVRWLQSLALPIWARCLLVIVLFAVMLGGLAMVVWALIWQQREAMTAGVGLLTVALPISLVVMALVFGQRSEKRLPEDFLLRPIEKLYFAQDLAFLVRGMAEAARIASAHPATP